MTVFFFRTFTTVELVLRVPSTKPNTTGGLAFIEGSKGNFNGNVSFEGNHAVTSGGKWKFENPFPAIRRVSVNQVHGVFRR